MDIEIDAALVRSLLAEQHPDLNGLVLEPGPTGWDHELWRLGETLAVRLPRRDSASVQIRNEQRWLPALAAQLPLPVPTPCRFGEPSEHFSRPWSVTAWVPGRPGDYAPISQALDSARVLAGFLRALHTLAPDDAPINSRRPMPLTDLAEEFDQRLQVVDDRANAAEVREVWTEALAARGHRGPRVWIHADLHPANVVVIGGTLAGVIDFGNMCSGDPAVDLAAAWLLLPARALSSFFALYGVVDTAMVRRARGWAVLISLGLISVGQAWDRGLPGGQPRWGTAGLAALQRVLASR